MCGISAYIGKTEREVNEVIAGAVNNKHRGDDGVGIIYRNKDKKLSITKLLLHLDEIYDKKLECSRANKIKRVGCFGIMCKDDGLYDTLQKEHAEEMIKLLTTKSDMIVVHHRKGTCGDNKLENLHPFEYNNKYYVHNGTVEGYQSIKNWLEINNNIKFKSDTDTEVLAVVYNLLKDTFKNKPKEIYKRMTAMFPKGFGVLLEISNDNITIIKDEERELWAYIYGKEWDRIYLTSEPTVGREKFTKLYRLGIGIYDIYNLMITDYTKECKLALECWNDSYNVSHPRIEKCDCCKTEEKPTCSAYYIKGGPLKDSRDSRCFECLVRSDLSSEVNEDEITTSIRETYAGYIGE